MKTEQNWMSPAAGLALAAIVGLSACSCNNSKEKKEPATQEAVAEEPQGTRVFATVPGEAGGVIEDTFAASATVSALDAATRKITLESSDGQKETFIAPPEIRNFDQIHVGDRVNVTLAERLVVFVDQDHAGHSAAYATAIARAPKGARPGAIIAQAYEVVATVKEIDTSARTATLEFSDGQTKIVPVRADVDMTRYRVGDKVVIRVSEELKVVVEAP